MAPGVLSAPVLEDEREITQFMPMNSWPRIPTLRWAYKMAATGSPFTTNNFLRTVKSMLNKAPEMELSAK